MSLSFDTAEGGSLLTYDCHRTVPAPFLTKTYHLVDDPATDDIVSWGEDETTFVVWRPPEFARDLLPNYFKHNNFSSFVRQLNTYGFRKIVPDRWEFANEFFRRGEKQLLCEIHRRKTCQLGSAAANGGGSGDPSISPSNSSGGEEGHCWSPFSTSPLSSPRTTCMVQLTTATHHQYHHQLQTSSSSSSSLMISDENERLRRDNRMLLLELSRLRRLYDDIVVILQHQSSTSSLPKSDNAAGPSNSSLRVINGLIEQKPGDTIPEQIEAAARRSEIRELSLQVLSRKDCTGGCGPQQQLLPQSTELPAIGCQLSKLLNGHQQQCATRAHPRSDSATPKASTLSFLDGKLREMASNSHKAAGVELTADAICCTTTTTIAPKLFGVSLHGKVNGHHHGPSNSCPDMSNHMTEVVGQKRPRSSTWLGPDESGAELPRLNNEGSTPPPVTTGSTNVVVTVGKLQQTNSTKNGSCTVLHRVGPATGSSKCVKTELGLEIEPRDPSVEAPWLRISATRDEQVFF